MLKPGDAISNGIEEFLFEIYLPGTKITKVKSSDGGYSQKNFSKSNCDIARCSWRKAGLNCTELCVCDLGDECDNQERTATSLDDVDSGEDDVEDYLQAVCYLKYFKIY